MATSELRFAAYVEGLVEVIGHADRAVPLQDYCLGLLMPGDRKSVEPMAAVARSGPDRSLDHRRYRLSQEGAAFGRRDTPVLRPARQAGQLPGGGHTVDRQPRGQPAGRIPALSAARVGRRSLAA